MVARSASNQIDGVDRDGSPRRVGYALLSEFSDDVGKRPNYPRIAAAMPRPRSFGLSHTSVLCPMRCAAHKWRLVSARWPRRGAACVSLGDEGRTVRMLA